MKILSSQASEQLFLRYEQERNHLSSDDKCKRLTSIIKAAVIEKASDTTTLERAKSELKELQIQTEAEASLIINALKVAGVSAVAFLFYMAVN